jgi:hypothetical protein
VVNELGIDADQSRIRQVVEYLQRKTLLLSKHSRLPMISLLDLVAIQKARAAFLKKEKQRKYYRKNREIMNEQNRQARLRKKTS